MVLRVLLASSNRNKLIEISRHVGPLPWEIVTPKELSLPREEPDIAETASTYLGNALLKAVGFGEWSGLATLADDSGLEVEALAGRPGIHSARFASSDDERNQKLIALLDAAKTRAATMRTVLCLYLPTGGYLVAEGRLPGSIAESPRGDSGWGYEPLFIPAGSDQTVAELRDRKVDIVTHRVLACKNLVETVSCF